MTDDDALVIGGRAGALINVAIQEGIPRGSALERWLAQFYMDTALLDRMARP